MSTITPDAPATALAESAPEPASVGPRKRWTTAEYDDLIRKGIIREGSRAFLWDGEIIEPMSENPPHINAAANLFYLLLMRLARDHWTVNHDAPVETRDGYKPEPDISILKGPRSRYRNRAPNPADIALLVETSSTSYSKDSGAFLKEYASAGIAQYWIVNIPERRIEVYRQPSKSGYASRTDYGLEDQVPLILDGEGGAVALGEIAVADVVRDSLTPDGADGWVLA